MFTPDKKKYICVLILLDFRYATSAKKSKKLIYMEMRIEMYLIQFPFKTFSRDWKINLTESEVYQLKF